ncbi:MAG TPA: chaperone modulator CbpM [Gammaproteobacteria bacterium]|nr:chaperone modulator CbpM [Gammaproteobacteria bacterium]
MAKSLQPISGVVLDEATVYTLSELGRASGLGADDLLAMVEVGILEPLPERSRWCFSGTSVTRLQTALRLRRDLGVNPEGAALVLDLLEEVRRLRSLERQLFD